MSRPGPLSSRTPCFYGMIPVCPFLVSFGRNKALPQKRIFIPTESLGKKDVNGEKLTVKNGGFGVPIFTVDAELFTVYKGRKR